MRDDGEPDLTPFFGCQPHVPDRTVDGERSPNPTKGPAPRVCPTCEGKNPEGSPFVCMGCHGVAPEHQAELDRAKVRAIGRREPEKSYMRADARSRTPGAAGRQSCSDRIRFPLKVRAYLVRNYPDLAPAWLQSIGQGVPTPAELDKLRKKVEARKKAEAAKSRRLEDQANSSA